MSIPEAFKGAAIEWSRLTSTTARVKYVARTSRLFLEAHPHLGRDAAPFQEAFSSKKAPSAYGVEFILKALLATGSARVQEIVGTITAVPFGARSLSLYKTLKQPSDPELRIQLQPDVRYGPASRNTMDIYSPPKLASAKPTPLWPSNAERADWQSRHAKALKGTVPRAPAPVVVFVHGGVWATGSKWHYTTMATRLCQAGCVVCVLEYSLYPTASADCMVREVSDALTFIHDNAATYGGDAGQVTLFGHSAGAHLCAMAMLHRCAAAGRAPAAILDEGGLCTHDSRLPARVLLAAGPYDISKHYEYEERRGVHMLSTMERALGGWAAFRARSPGVIIASVVNALAEQPAAPPPLLAESVPALKPRGLVASGSPVAAHGRVSAEGDAGDGTRVAAAVGSSGIAVSNEVEAAGADAGVDAAISDVTAVPIAAASSSGAGVAERAAGAAWRGVKRSRGEEQPREAGGQTAMPSAEALNPAGRQRFFEMFPLAGDAIAARAGHLAAAHAGGEVAGGEAATAIMLDGAEFRPDAADAAERFAAGLTVADVRRLPPVVLLSSSRDTTVPWHESAEMFHVLRAAGVPARHLMYDDVSHAGFVMSWRIERDEDGLPAGMACGVAPEAPPKFMQDTVRLVLGEVQV